MNDVLCFEYRLGLIALYSYDDVFCIGSISQGWVATLGALDTNESSLRAFWESHVHVVFPIAFVWSSLIIVRLIRGCPIMSRLSSAWFPTRDDLQGTPPFLIGVAQLHILSLNTLVPAHGAVLGSFQRAKQHSLAQPPDFNPTTVTTLQTVSFPISKTPLAPRVPIDIS